MKTDSSGKDYFKRSEAYEKKCIRTVGDLCKQCLHRNDQHDMNCIECCPLRRAFDAWKQPANAKLDETPTKDTHEKNPFQPQA